MLRWFPHGRTYLLTRSCLGGEFRLTPNRSTRQIFLYTLALAAERYKIDIHAVTVMCNKYHIVATARKRGSDLAKFMRCLNLNTAFAFNRTQNRRGTMWVPGSYGLQYLNTPDEVLKAMARAICEPVNYGLVRHYTDWPGFLSTPQMTVSFNILTLRPAIFGNDSQKEEEVRLRFVKPPMFNHLSNSQFIKALTKLVNARLREIREIRQSQGLGYLTAEAIRRQRFDQCPQSPNIVEMRRAVETETCVDHIWEQDDQQAYRSFCEKHQECLEEVQAGGRPIFPYGTYKMAITYGFPVEPDPE